jgi:hypothetical protein
VDSDSDSGASSVSPVIKQERAAFSGDEAADSVADDSDSLEGRGRKGGEGGEEKEDEAAEEEEEEREREAVLELLKSIMVKCKKVQKKKRKVGIEPGWQKY